MYSRHVYGSNIPLKYTVMLWYQQLHLRNKISMFWACLFSKIFEPCVFSNRRLLSLEYGTFYLTQLFLITYTEEVFDTSFSVERFCYGPRANHTDGFSYSFRLLITKDKVSNHPHPRDLISCPRKSPCIFFLP